MAKPARRIRWRYRQGTLVFRVVTDARRPLYDSLPCVLIHGIGMSHRYLSRLHDALAANGPTFSIDLPGHAGLPKPGREVTVPEMARALTEVIASLKTDRVVLIGHSMGTQWATEVAIQRPDLVAHLVIAGPVTDSRHRSLPAQTMALGRDTLGESLRTNAIVFSDYLRCGIRWYLAQARQMLSYPIEERVKQLTMPLLVIRGARDPIAGLEWCRRLRDSVPSASLIMVPRHHHNVQDSAPHAVAHAIRSYTDRPQNATGALG